MLVLVKNLSLKSYKLAISTANENHQNPQKEVFGPRSNGGLEAATIKPEKLLFIIAHEWDLKLFENHNHRLSKNASDQRFNSQITKNIASSQSPTHPQLSINKSLAENRG